MTSRLVAKQWEDRIVIQRDDRTAGGTGLRGVPGVRGGRGEHVNIISIRRPSEAVEEAAAYQGKIGSRLEVYQEIGEMLNLRILIPWTQGGSN